MSRRDINVSTHPPSFRLQWQTAIGESDLPTESRLVGWALSTWMNSEGFCWPQQSEIARRAGVSDRTVRRALRQLRKDDFLFWITGGGPRRPNRYQALLRTQESAFGTRMADTETLMAETERTNGVHARHDFDEEVTKKYPIQKEEPDASLPLRGSRPPEEPNQERTEEGAQVGPNEPTTQQQALDEIARFERERREWARQVAAGEADSPWAPAAGATPAADREGE